MIYHTHTRAHAHTHASTCTHTQKAVCLTPPLLIKHFFSFFDSLIVPNLMFSLFICVPIPEWAMVPHVGYLLAVCAFSVCVLYVVSGLNCSLLLDVQTPNITSPLWTDGLKLTGQNHSLPASQPSSTCSWHSLQAYKNQGESLLRSHPVD